MFMLETAHVYGMVENAGTGYRIRIPDTDTGYGYRIRIPDTDTGYGYRIRIPDTDTGYGYRIRIPDTDTGYGIRIPDSLKYLFLRIKIVGYCIFSRFLSHF